MAITDKYGLELSRLPYDEQTAQTDNMIAQLEAIDLSLLPAVQRWIALIKTANDNFKVTVVTYLKGQTEDSDTAAASIAAIPLGDALKALFTIHFAHAQVSKTDTLVNAYKELTFLVNSYR
ncbi:hypothetical protein N6H18_18445 [Reichenbachiella agarivorans]|uniref:Uncharacterized protein n=1 Tax=Reichenbachiella agarivorans TaxID=2979464 RepID=A0ABY6CPB7_9BACT|nr:hypothetical protein [Reichenbachiella agarivorans]UXP32322.1 hypothetical protein N6H18_18445 [Reichenbachiella agarivorans]